MNKETIKPRFQYDRNLENTKNEWLTPPELIKSLGQFDLDPCAPVEEKRPWATANKHYDISQDGLKMPWVGRVWCNPPYETKLAAAFLEKCLNHGNAIALIFARTETANWFNYIWGKADCVLFVKGRLTFYHANGNKAVCSAGAPSALIAYGKENAQALLKSNLGYCVS